MASRHSPRCATLIPKSTCSRALDRLSARTGVAVIAAAAPARSRNIVERVKESRIRRIGATIAHGASHVPRESPRKLDDLRAHAGWIYETWSRLSTAVETRAAIIDVGRTGPARNS